MRSSTGAWTEFCGSGMPADEYALIGPPPQLWAH